MRVTLSIALLLTAALTITACKSEDAASPNDIVLPPAGAQFDYQLGGNSPVPPGAEVVARDSTDDAAEDAYGICYVNGFQTQPGVAWPAALLVHTDDGELLVDPGWPDENILDTSTPAKRAAIAERLKTTVDGCDDSGYLAVEFDNFDSWTRSGGALDEADAVAFATQLVESAHARGLAAAQKNAPEVAEVGRNDIGFDLAITEQCDRYDECDAYTAAYGGLVYNIEYADDLRGTVDAVCSRVTALDPSPSTIVRDHNLVPANDDDYVYTTC
ncbi:endo alpha-1,4 polygalactosaminidase [Marisediminicola senii]|uniref:endo alpha-1,4 polygalactosaminidase n=1 Tax=Marisediminicola senii TaxID=2711233 RepID=UPI0013EDF477|nr:endo alpha-1,4 polygalactosaminidase [Marisediminicola senii]